MYFGIPIIGYRLPDGSYLENKQLEPDIRVANTPECVLRRSIGCRSLFPRADCIFRVCRHISGGKNHCPFTYTGHGLKIDEIVTGGPLDRATSRVRAGDIITEINGHAITPDTDFSVLLNGIYPAERIIVH